MELVEGQPLNVLVKPTFGNRDPASVTAIDRGRPGTRLTGAVLYTVI